MSIRERLKIAYENVAYNADKTWRTEYFNLQRSHMDLFLRENQLQRPTCLELRPRTVRDSIPNSKLAKYSNYEYSYSRELSYNADEINKPSRPLQTFDNDSEMEPWMTEEVDQLFKFYSNEHSSQTKRNRLHSYKYYESPFLKTNSLPECFLKLQITNSRVKKLWDIENRNSEYFMRNFSTDESYLLYKSSSGQHFLSECDQMKGDTHKLEKETMNIQSESCAIQNRRLYSAVLQGFSTSKIPSSSAENRMTILKRNLTRNGMEKLNSINEVNRIKMEDCSKQTEEISLFRKSPKADCSIKFKTNNFNKKFFTTPKNSIGASYNPLYNVNHIQSQLESMKHHTRLLSNNVVPQTSNPFTNPSLVARLRPTPSTNNSQYSSYVLLQNSLQQQRFLQPLLNSIVLQRSATFNFDRVVPQRALHMPTNNLLNTTQVANFQQTHYKTNNSNKVDSSSFRQKLKAKLENAPTKKEIKSSGLISLVNVRKTSDISSCSSCNSTSKLYITQGDFFESLEKLVLKTVDLALDDSKSEVVVPVTESSSERLERQALEQYQGSCDNVFLELERQAAEEYEDCSENYKVPPGKFLFGGFSIQCHYFCFSMNKYFKYLVS